MEIGKKIRELRMRKGLTQEELANRSELSKGFISQLENDVTSPSIATLVDVLTCLGTDLKTFFGEEQDNQIVFCEEDYFVKTDEAQGNEIAWIVPNAQKNRMEPIRLTLQSGACTEVDSPHEGEEFGYVLSGRVLIHLGDECHKAKKGESFYYPASCDHYLENPGVQAWNQQLKTEAKSTTYLSGVEVVLEEGEKVLRKKAAKTAAKGAKSAAKGAAEGRRRRRRG